MAAPKDPSMENLAFPPADERMRLRLFQQALIGAAAMLGALWWSASNTQDWIFYLGLAICALALLPALVWTRTMGHNYPIFEIFIATNLTSYGIPLLTEHDAATLFEPEVRQDASLAVIAFLAAASLAYYVTRGTPRTTPFWTRQVLERPNKQWMLRGLILSTLYTLIVPYLYVPPAGIEGILRAVFFGIGTSCTFIIAIAWGLGRLQRGDQVVVVACLALQFILLSSSLILRAGTSIILLGIVGYFFGARRIPYIALAIALPVLAVLNIGKYDLRQKYWSAESHYQPGLADLPAYYAEWCQAGLRPKVQTDSKASKLLLERNSLLQILCLVVDRTPDYQPYLYGETYKQIPGQFVPRLFWPEKPRGHISTYTLSIYYGLQNEEATYETTIAFGFLPEAFANFGYWGVIGLGVVFGFGFRKITLWSARSPIFSYAGLMLVLLTAWSFQTELTLSGWLASLFQGSISIIAFVFVFRRFQDVSG
ncbi:MAG TPA: hypothetical protein VLW52_07285 [Opitutaceae bacterium]|nr:hypothetical protein [Opitutaceae bacterium]